MKRLAVAVIAIIMVAVAVPAQASTGAMVPAAAYGCGEKIMTVWQDQIRVGFGQSSTVTLKVCHSTYGGNTRIHAVRVFSPGDKVRGLEGLRLWANNPLSTSYQSWGPSLVDKGEWQPIGLIACRGACNQLRMSFTVGVNRKLFDPSISTGNRVP
jgi:hypothetical protein